MTAFFISDLHLSPDRPAMAALFERFLAHAARHSNALYVLGDLFEYWAGDDDLASPFNQRVVSALENYARDGKRLYFMRGNRDFLIGDEFARTAKLTLLDDPSRVALDDGPAMVSHGDILCQSDAEYQAFRARVRSPQWRGAFLAKPLAERKREIEAMRAQSEAGKRTKPMEIMDVTPTAVEAFFREHQCARLIHGHTHRPKRHQHHVDGRACERWVLADWYDAGSYLSSGAHGLRSHAFP